MHTLSKSAYALAICLSALAGCVDAIGFLQLGGHFISFMSGNSTQLAVGIATGETARVMLLAAIIGLFVAGAMLGVWVRHFSGAASAVTAVLVFITLLLTAAALSHEMGLGFAVIAFMTLAMGAENAVFQRDGEVVVGLTYMTGTLVKAGQRLAHAMLGGPKFAWVPYLMLWCGLIVGGIAGTLLFHLLGLRSLWVAVLFSGALSVVTRALRSRLAS